MLKAFEKATVSYFGNINSKFQCSFRKEFSTLQCLLFLTEKWKEAGDKYEALPIDVLKEFDYLNQHLLVAYYY